MTMMNDAVNCSLEATIAQGRFFEVDDVTILHRVRDAFPDELERLKSAYAVERESPPKGNGANGVPRQRSPSQILYGKDFDEINRTLVGVLALRWIHNNEYDIFTHCQPPHLRLHRESFDWLRGLFEKHIRNSNDLFALVLSMVINDLGKDPNLEEDYFYRTGTIIKGMNHDMILFEAAKAGMIPCLNRLDPKLREDVLLGLELGSELNAGQLAQAENVPINLEGLTSMRGHESAFYLKFMEQILDVAGASGHGDATCAKRLSEPAFQAFKVVHEVALEIIAGRSTLRKGYDKVLTKRADILERNGWKQDRRLTVNSDEDRALLRLLTMGRTSEAAQADLFQAAFEGLEAHQRKLLVEGLNVDGTETEGQRAVIPYYMPAMFSELLENTKDEDFEHRKAALMSLMRYLSRVLSHEDEEPKVTTPIFQSIPEDVQLSENMGQGVPGIVIERNVMKARETINGDAFKNDPSVLDMLEIPQGRELPRRRTSQSM